MKPEPSHIPTPPNPFQTPPNPSLDVIVVGAGPAGAIAARALALGGVRVQVLERYRFPRNKPCGGAISMRAMGRFPFLRDALPRVSTRLISRLCLESPSGETVTLESPSPAALMIRRIEFDDALVRLAQEAGADLIEGVEVVQAQRDDAGVCLTARNGRVFRAPLVVAADGANSVLARRLGLNAGWPPASVALDMMEETSFDDLQCQDPDLLWVAYGYKGSHGYAYIFPKHRHVNVGIGYLLSYYRSDVDEAPYHLQGHLVESLCARGALAGTSQRCRFTPALIPVGGPLKRTVVDRVLLTGDAGGFVNGFSAEGIYYAMVSGDLAARAILGGSPAAYERLWRREIGAELRDSVLVQRFLFRDPARIDRMVCGARSYPSLAQGLVDYAMGRLTYRAARRRLILKVPTVVAKMVMESFGFSTIRVPWHNRRSQLTPQTRFCNRSPS